MADSPDITALLEAARDGDAAAAQEVLPLVYDELRSLAAHMFAREPADHTLQPTALVNEAWIKLAGQSRAQYENRRHFIAVAAGAMRRLLIDHARGRGRDKRGAGWEAVTFDEELAFHEVRITDALALEAAFERLAHEDERQARVAELRIFGGLELSEIAAELGVSTRTIKRDWKQARERLEAWMQPEPRQLLVVTVTRDGAADPPTVHDTAFATTVEGHEVRVWASPTSGEICVLEDGKERTEASPVTVKLGDTVLVAELYLGFG